MLVDGAETQLDLVEAGAAAYGVDVTVILDIIHVVEYVWKAAHVFHREGSPELACWAWTRVRDILEGKARRVASSMRRAATVAGLSPDARKPVDTCADYLLKYAPYLQYDRHLAAGYPIATGVVEGACRHLVRDRMELTGARWRLVGAEAVLKLRALRASGDFDAYWDFHEAREYERNHAQRYAGGKAPRGHRAAPAAFLTPSSTRQVALTMPLAERSGPLWTADEKEPHPIAKVWEWSGTRLPEEHWALNYDVLTGCANTGAGYLTHRWRELRFIVLAMIDWFSLSKQERGELATAPWRFAGWLADRRLVQGRQFRHALLFLLFPDSFEPILVGSHKREIVKSFARLWGEAPPASADDVAIDRRLLATRTRLQTEHAEGAIDFYRFPFVDEWRTGWAHPQKRPTPDDLSSSNSEDDEAWFRERFGQADVWVIAPGKGARRWADFQQHGIAAVDYDDVGDLSEYASLEAIRQAAVESGLGPKPINHSLAMWEFAHDMRIDDVLIAKQGVNILLGWGTVRGNYVYDPNRADFQHVRRVEWHTGRKPVELARNEGRVAVKTLTRVTRYTGWVRRAFGLMESNTLEPSPRERDGRSVDRSGEEPEPYDVESALDDVFIPDRQFSRMLDALAVHKNLILQGPPGVGKTWIARRLAWCLIGRRDSRAIEMVQFHQSYAYEDFVQGWRPNEAGGFTRKNGVFFQFCKRAEKLDTPFVFIIDEINRGNLSRIFGELLMLVERDKRGPDHAIPLTYSRAGERFSVPDNVHLLGMMNTADRSLAMVDYALRRRFAFEDLKPAYGTEEFREHLLEAGVDRTLVDRIEKNLTELNARIRDDKDLGWVFQIGHSFFVPDDNAEQPDEHWYVSVVETQIVPLLREYWFDRPERVEDLLEMLRR